MSVVNLSDGDAVDKFIKINSKVVLYYTATWCGPCRAIKPFYEDLSKQYASDGVSFGKIDIDDNPEAAQNAQISSVPTFVGYIDEKVIDKFSGADSGKLSSLVEQLKNH
jgi:thioredoxin 1